MTRGLDTGYDSRKNRWEVYEMENGYWGWVKFGEGGKVLKESKRAFGTMDECKEDAEAHGMDGKYFTLFHSD